MIFRFKNDTDLLAGMDKMVKQEKIKNAVILSAAGSLKGYHVHQISNSTFPSKNTFVKDPTAPCDLISMNGYVINGRIHAHMTLSNPDKAFGGHLELEAPCSPSPLLRWGSWRTGSISAKWTTRAIDDGPAAPRYHPTGFPAFCSSSHFCSGAK